VLDQGTLFEPDFNRAVGFSVTSLLLGVGSGSDRNTVD